MARLDSYPPIDRHAEIDPSLAAVAKRSHSLGQLNSIESPTERSDPRV